jgi:hypothetical protein
MEKFKNNSGCKRKAWFDEALFGDFAMVGDEGADTADDRACQNIHTASPFSWFFWVMNEIFPLKPTTDSSTDRFWPGIKCSLNLASMYLRKLLTFCVLVLKLWSEMETVSKCSIQNI